MGLLRVLSSVSPPWAGHLGSGACSLALPKGVRGKDRMVPYVEDMLVPHSLSTILSCLLNSWRSCRWTSRSA